jgi:hypothetical protein
MTVFKGSPHVMVITDCCLLKSMGSASCIFDLRRGQFRVLSVRCGSVLQLRLQLAARPLKIRLSSPCHSANRMTTLEEVGLDNELDREIQSLSTDDIATRTRLLENEIKVRSACLWGVDSRS